MMYSAPEESKRAQRNQTSSMTARPRECSASNFIRHANHGGYHSQVALSGDDAFER